jgi:hypothetical protein
MIRRYAAMAILASAILGLGLGCSSGGKKVQVKVTMDDKPLAGATVTFIPQTGSSLSASGLTDENGLCTLKAGNSDTVPAGEYQVTIAKVEAVSGMPTGDDPMEKMKKAAAAAGSAPKAGGGPGLGPTGPKGQKSLIPEKYNDTTKSGLTCKVPDETSGVKVFNLSSK